MEATLRFDLSEQSDVINCNRCLKSLDMALSLSDILNIERNYEKREVVPSIEDVFGEINAILEQRGILLDELIE